MSDSTSMDHLIVERDGHVLTLTLNRPEARNAFSGNMLARMAEAWDTIDSDPDIRVAIITGAGGVFSSGADLKAMNASPAPDDEYGKRFKQDATLAWKALLRHHTLTKPLIAAVEGFAIAGGTEILQATDIRVAARTATFGIAEVTRGLFPLGGSTVRLQRQIPYTRAMDILLTGRRVPAEEAYELGLISHVVEEGEALAKAREIADVIAGNGPLAVQAVLKSVKATAALPEAEAMAIELEIGMQIFTTNDAKEGPRAFAEKRSPNFTGT